MSDKQKSELYVKLQALGFTYDEARALRRVEITLRRWSAEVASSRIKRFETRAYRLFELRDRSYYEHIADREAGALLRTRMIVKSCNDRNCHSAEAYKPLVTFYHRPHPTGCNLFLVTRARLGDVDISNAVRRGLAVTSD